MNIIETLRKSVITDLLNTGVANSYWQTWSRLFRQYFGNNPTADTILNSGEHLSEIFKSTGTAGRSQSDLSKGGKAWELLITWYINLCTINSRVVAINKKGTLPKAIKESFTVNYSNLACSSESDITVVVFPDLECFTADNADLITWKGNVNKRKLNELVSDNFDQFEVGIVQCKTNWNDTAQIPMLWDMVYAQGGFSSRQITVGSNNYSIDMLKKFTYSFATVPTNKLDTLKSNSLPVGRVKNISGGNYWGLPSAQNIASNVKDIFRNFRDGFVNYNIRNTLTPSLPLLSNPQNYFKV